MPRIQDPHDSDHEMAIYAGGLSDFEAQHDWRSDLAIEMEILDRRCGRICRPSGIMGKISFALRRRKLARRIAAKFDPMYSVFTATIPYQKLQANQGSTDQPVEHYESLDFPDSNP